MFAKSMLFSALLAVATTTQAAVPGEVIVAINTNAAGVGRAAVMSPDGSNLAYVSCLPGEVLNPTHMSSPRYFAGRQQGSNVLYVNEFGNESFNMEIAAADEDCGQVAVLSNTGNMFMRAPKWSPDGTMIAVEAAEHEFGNPAPIQQGIYLADVVYAGNRPTGVSNLRLLIEGPGGFDWSPDSGSLVHARNGDLHVYSLATGVSVNITNSSGKSETFPAWSSTGRIAYNRLTAASRSGDRYDIYSIPQGGGPELQVTAKSSVASTFNMAASYSPDGKYLVFSSCSAASKTIKGALGDCALYRILSDGSGKAVKVVGGNGQSWTNANWRR